MKALFKEWAESKLPNEDGQEIGAGCPASDLFGLYVRGGQNHGQKMRCPGGGKPTADIAPSTDQSLIHTCQTCGRKYRTNDGEHGWNFVLPKHLALKPNAEVCRPA